MGTSAFRPAYQLVNAFPAADNTGHLEICHPIVAFSTIATDLLAHYRPRRCITASLRRIPSACMIDCCLLFSPSDCGDSDRLIPSLRERVPSSSSSPPRHNRPTRPLSTQALPHSPPPTAGSVDMIDCWLCEFHPSDGGDCDWRRRSEKRQCRRRRLGLGKRPPPYSLSYPP